MHVDVDPAELLGRRGNPRGQGVAVGGVDGAADDGAERRHLRDSGVDTFGVAGADRHGGAFGEQRLGDRSSDALRGSRDECLLAAESEVHGCLLWVAPSAHGGDPQLNRTGVHDVPPDRPDPCVRRQRSVAIDLPNVL